MDKENQKNEQAEEKAGETPPVQDAVNQPSPAEGSAETAVSGKEETGEASLSEKKSYKPQKKGGRGKSRPPRRVKKEGEDDFVEKVVAIRRVAKVVKGGRRFSFSATVILGDGRDSAGLGFGKANEISGAIQKAFIDARKNFFKVEKNGTTIPHAITGHFKAANVLLKPGPEGTGVIAGGPVRAVCEACGIKDVYAKSLGSNNPTNVMKATIDGLRQMRSERR